jgi:hypothetical protein
MNRLVLIAALLALLPVSRPAAGAPARAAVPSALAELDALRGEVHKAEAAVAPLYERRASLSAAAASLAAQIDELKRKPAGVRRDADLQRLLADSKARTDELERVQGELRWREPGLGELRRKLVRSIDVALEHEQKALSEAARLDLDRLRTATVALLVSPAAPLQIAPERAAIAVDPLDGPRELRYKADLLRDSGDKLRREASRIASRIDSVERRRHLRERAGSLDDDMFGEATSNRRVARTQGALAAHTNDKAAEQSPSDPSRSSANDSATPTPAAPPSAGAPTGTGGLTGGGSSPVTTPNSPSTGGSTTTNGSTFANGGSKSATSSESTVLRNLVDPRTLDELRRADEIDDVDRQTRALKKAQSELESLAKELDRRAKALEGRAAELRNQK